MIDLNRKPKQKHNDDGFGGMPFGAVCGFLIALWTLGLIAGSMLGWM